MSNLIRTYDFKCEHCKVNFEKEIDYRDILKVKCPTCHRTAKKVILSPVPVKFLGKGFYLTDNSHKSKKEEG